MLRSLKHPNIEFEIVQVKEQILIKFNFIKVLMFHFLNYKTVLTWQVYLQSNIFSKKFLKLIVTQLFSIFLSLSNFRLYRKKISIINAISHKHSSARDFFMNSISDFLVVLESDAQIPDKKEFIETIRTLVNYKTSSPGYFCLLGGGFEFSKLNIGKLNSRNVNKLKIYDRAFTNTGVAYAFDKKTAKFLQNCFSHYPKGIPLLPYDWLINYSLIRLSRQGIFLEGLRPETDQVQHGSRMGTTNSWQD